MRSGNQVVRVVAGMVIACAAFGGSVFADGVSLSRVLDTSAAIPLAGGSFAGFSQASMDGGEIVFFADRSLPNGRGIYLRQADGAIVLVADLATSIPSGSGDFVKLDRYWPVLRNGRIIFCGEGDSGQDGVYSWIDGGLAVVADTQTVIPGSSQTFTVFTQPSYDGEAAVISAVRNFSNDSGIFTCVPGGPLSVIVNAWNQYPGTSVNFSWFGLPYGASAGSEGFIFSGYTATGLKGVHRATSAGLQNIASGSTIWPRPGMKMIGGENPVAVDGDNVLFACEQIDMPGVGEGDGLYGLINGEMIIVADCFMSMPGGNGVFWRIYFGAEGVQASMKGDLVAFRAADGGASGNPPVGSKQLFFERLSTGEIGRIAGVGDSLDGGVVTGLDLSKNAIADDTIAFTAKFADGSQAIYIADVAPPPPCPADIDASGDVDIDDLFSIINQWGPCSAERACAGDVDASGDIDVDDLFVVINAWGSCL